MSEKVQSRHFYASAGRFRSTPINGHRQTAPARRVPTADVLAHVRGSYVPILLQKSKIELLRKSRVS
jgi:hypothetical protein